MTFTVYAETPAGPWPEGRRMTPWDDVIYDDPNRALDVARVAFESRDMRVRMVVLDAAGETWDEYVPEPRPAVWPGNPQVAPADDGHVLVTFRWSTEYGDCFECNAPAGWVIWPYGDEGESERACAVCACNHAEDTTRVENIADHINAHGYAPDEDAPDEDTGAYPDEVALAGTSEGRAVLGRAVELAADRRDNGVDVDDDGSAEVKRLIRALPDGYARRQLVAAFPAEADEVADETPEG